MENREVVVVLLVLGFVLLLQNRQLTGNAQTGLRDEANVRYDAATGERYYDFLQREVVRQDYNYLTPGGVGGHISPETSRSEGMRDRYRSVVGAPCTLPDGTTGTRIRGFNGEFCDRNA